MNKFQSDLYNNLMALLDSEAFFYTDQVVNGATYRIFNYRLASFTEFQRPGALESRGHTFMLHEDGSPFALVSMPMQKFFNLGENPLVMNLDLSAVHRIMDKLDGSLISTVSWNDGSREFTIKTKGSFFSEQAQAAKKLLNTPEYAPLVKFIGDMTEWGWTVNMEYCSPDNQIVLGYAKPMLRVLNVRSMITGEYLDEETILAEGCPKEMLVETFTPPSNVHEWVESVNHMKGREGFVVTLKDGTWFKLKTEEYSALHKTKDSVTIPRRLFEACVLEAADDLRGMFRDDPLSISRINEMEALVAKHYNHLSAVVDNFYQTNKELDRKSYAIKGQAELAADGVFSLAMNAYIGRPVDLKEFMIKNYKRFGIKDEEPVEVE